MMDRANKKIARDSNMEAMRIYSMLLVLIVHGCFKAGVRIPLAEFIPNLDAAITVWSTEAFSLIGVNCFVLISGYYTIKPKFSSIFNLVYTVLFYRFFIYLFVYCSSTIQFSTISFLKYLLSFDWFVVCYLGLILFSPILNSFIETTPPKFIRNWIIIFMLLNILFGYIFITYPYINFYGGYSLLSFIGLYLMGRYYRLYYKQKLTKRGGIFIYVISVTLKVTLVIIGILLLKPSLYPYIENRFMAYSSPLTIIAAIGVLIFFSKLDFYSNAVNRFAKSAFSVYLIHTNPFLCTYYNEITHSLYSIFPGYLWLPSLIIFSIILYLSLSFIDQIRIFSCECVNHYIFTKPNKSQHFN